MIVVVSVLLTVDTVGALFQIATPPLPVLVLTIAAGAMIGSWYGVGKAFANSQLLTSWTASQADARDYSN